MGCALSGGALAGSGADAFGMASQGSRFFSDTLSGGGQVGGANRTREGEQGNANAQLTQGTVGVSQDATARFRSLAQSSVDQLNTLNQTIAQGVKSLNEAVRM